MNELIALALRRAGVGTLAEFQALQGLPQTGIDDPETRAALEPICWVTGPFSCSPARPSGPWRSATAPPPRPLPQPIPR